MIKILSTVRYPLIDIQHLLSEISTEQFVIENDIISAHIANIMASKNSHIPIRSRMRGVPYVVTCGGSAIVEDVTSENQDYTPVGYYHKVSYFIKTTQLENLDQIKLCFLFFKKQMSCSKLINLI